MRTSLLVPLVFAAIGGSARAQDYQALLAELQTLKADTDVVAYLEGDLKRAHQLQTLEAAMEARHHLAEEYRAQAQDLRRLQDMALSLQVVPQARSPDTTEDPAPQELELRAARQVEIARDTLVELVAGYREAKALAGAQKKARAKKK